MWDPRVHVGTAAIIMDPSERVLVIQRAEDATHGASTWGLPGGWIDYGEWPEEGCRRELMEEVGVNAINPKLRGAVSNTWLSPVDTAVCLFYQFDWHRSIEPRICEPHKIQDITWMSPQTLESVELFAPLQTFMERVSFDNLLSSNP